MKLVVAADAHWCARDDADETVAFFLTRRSFEKALFFGARVGRRAVDFFDVGDVAGSDTPVKRHSDGQGWPLRGEKRERMGNEAGDNGRRGTAAVKPLWGENRDELQCCNSAWKAWGKTKFGDGFGDLELFLRVLGGAGEYS